MDTSVLSVTVKCAVPNMTGSVSGTVAVIVMGPPTCNEVASPLEPSAALLMVATVVSEELQVTEDVRFCVEKSEYVPMAINCCFVPRAILGLTGVTAMDSSVAAVTVKCAVPEIVPDAAVIVIGPPMAIEVANPLSILPVTVLMVATSMFEDVQVTDDVRSKCAFSA